MRYRDEEVIRVLVDFKPKRPGSEARRVFNYYRDGMTVGEFRQKVKNGSHRPGYANDDLKWNDDHGFIGIEPPGSRRTRAAPTRAVDPARDQHIKLADSDEGKTVTGATRQLAEIAIEAVRCNACFESGRLERSYVDLAQPRYVGSGYDKQHPKIAWVMINPGAGSANEADQSWRSVLRAYRDGQASLDNVFAEQRRHMAAWSNFLSFLDKHGLDLDSIALVNVAWCAAQENKHPAWMLSLCWDRHTRSWLSALAPDIVYLSGSDTHPIEARIHSLLPASLVRGTFHYAHRPLDADRANARAAELRKELAGIRRRLRRKAARNSDCT